MNMFIIQAVMKTDETDENKALKEVRELLQKKFQVVALVMTHFDMDKQKNAIRGHT